MKKSLFRRKSDTRFNSSINRDNVVRITTNLKTSIKKHNDPVYARKFVTIGVIVSLAMVLVSFGVTIYFNPERLAKQKFEELAVKYYETYYYDRLVESVEPEQFEQQMAKYEQTGFQPVLLRQLLLYQNGKYNDYKGYFEKDGFNCDKNETSATFYPVKPYGRNDYTVEYSYKCEKE